MKWVTWSLLEHHFDALEWLRLFSTTDSSELQIKEKLKIRKNLKAVV